MSARDIDGAGQISNRPSALVSITPLPEPTGANKKPSPIIDQGSVDPYLLWLLVSAQVLQRMI